MSTPTLDTPAVVGAESARSPSCAAQGAPATPDVARIIDGLIHRATQLYTLPAVAAKVLQLTNEPQVDAHAVKQCIENDPALTTRVLRVVNSSLFGLRCEVTDLNQALALLGTKPLKLLVLGFSLPGGLFAGVGASTLGWYWRRTLTKAVAAREICETVWRRPGDESFIAALLQDLGMLVLIQELGAPYIDFLEKVRQRGCDVSAMETASMGFDHTALTAALLAHWGLPEALVEAVRLRPGDEGRPAAGTGNLRCVVDLAEQIARLLADDRPEALEQLLTIGQRTHHLSSEQLTALVDRLEEKVRSLADALSQALPETTDYRELLALAHARLSDEAADAAGRMLAQQRADAASAGAAALVAEMQSLGQATARFARRSAERAPPRAAEPPAPALSARESQPSKTLRTTSHPAGGAAGDPQVGLLGHLAKAVAACRQSRSALSLLLVELGSADDLVLAHGLETFHQLRAGLEKACRNIDHETTVCLPYHDAGFAVILSGCDRQLAVRLGNRLIERVCRSAADTEAAGRLAPIVCAGAATVGMPPKNFPPKDLMVAADRCLNGSRASGGGVVKSIEIY